MMILWLRSEAIQALFATLPIGLAAQELGLAVLDTWSCRSEHLGTSLDLCGHVGALGSPGSVAGDHAGFHWGTHCLERSGTGTEGGTNDGGITCALVNLAIGVVDEQELGERIFGLLMAPPQTTTILDSDVVLTKCTDFDTSSAGFPQTHVFWTNGTLRPWKDLHPTERRLFR